MYHFMGSISFGLLFLVCAVTRGENEPFAEVEILRAEHVSELTVFIVNPGDRDFEFPTGASGHGGDVRPGENAGSYSGITVIPRLTFEVSLDEGRKPRASAIELQAPRYYRRWEYHSDRKPEVFIVRPGKRRLYYSFKVPTEYIQGKFLGGYLPRPDLEYKTTGYGNTKMGAIRITRLIDMTDTKETTEGAEKP